MLKGIFKQFEEDCKDQDMARKINIAVVGCGGGGTNSINRLNNMELEDVTTVALNTDSQHLYMVKADKKLLIGERLTSGHGAGGDPRLGQVCAEEAKSDLRNLMGKPDITFITVGLGGGTGTGSAPVVAEVAKNTGSLVVALVTMPFRWEGNKRKEIAMDGLQKLMRRADSVIILDNDKLLKLVPRLPFDVAFGFMDQLVAQTISGMAEAVTKTSLINIDFADIKAILGDGGMSTILCGDGTIDEPEKAVSDTLKNSLLDVDYQGATGAVIHITCDTQISLETIDKIVRGITQNLSDDANVIFGVRQEAEMEGTVRVLTILTGVHSPHLPSTVVPMDHKQRERPVRSVKESRVERRRGQILTLEEVLA